MSNLLASLVFLLWTVIYWVGTACVAKVFFIATQDGQLLGSWQQRLRKWDLRGDSWGQLLAKIGGYCELCYSHAWAIISLVIYSTWTAWIIGVWPPSWGPLWLSIIFNIIWSVVYVHTSTIITLFVITKLFKNGTPNN